MFRRNDQKAISGIGFHFFNGVWSIPSFMDIAYRGGSTLAVSPVSLIPLDDHQKLSEAIKAAFFKDREIIPEWELNTRIPKPSAEATALGLKSERAFERQSRYFSVVRMPNKLVSEEWTKSKGGGFVANPPKWFAEFGPEDFAGLAKQLVGNVKDDV
jgi:hypothetical protein